MDITAFNELIALARGTAASLAQAEQKVAAFKDELAEQAKDAQGNAAVAPVRAIKSIPKRTNSGWVAAIEKLPKAS
jgi:hypothetical protein